MKTELYQFTVDRKVGKKKEKVKVSFMKPTHSMLEDAEFYYASEFNALVNSGFLTRAMMNKKMGDIGGAVSKNSAEQLGEVIKDLLDAQKAIQFYEGAETLTDEQQDSLDKAKSTFGFAQKQLIEHDMNLQQAYAQTADNKAQERLIRWLVLNCAFFYDSVGDKEERFELFDGSSLDEKRKCLNDVLDYEETDTDKTLAKRASIVNAAISTLTQVAAIWYNGMGKDQKTIGDKLKELAEDESSS